MKRKARRHWTFLLLRFSGHSFFLTGGVPLCTYFYSVVESNGRSGDTRTNVAPPVGEVNGPLPNQKDYRKIDAESLAMCTFSTKTSSRIPGARRVFPATFLKNLLSSRVAVAKQDLPPCRICTRDFILSA